MRYVQISLMILTLVVIGIFSFGKLEQAEVRIIELAVRLESFYLMQSEHRKEHKVFFDPRVEPFRSNLSWLDEYKCEIGVTQDAFAITVGVDFDEDGKKGVWQMNHRTRIIHLLVED